MNPSRRSQPDQPPIYRAREFADRAGVTVKTLLHYERIGLLTPARTSAGHRRYSEHDGEQLRCIVALKEMGVPLAQMRELFDASPAALIARLTTKRKALAQEQQRLLRAERALALVEESLRHSPDSRGLRRLADVVDARRDVGRMKRYFTDDVWGAARRFYEEWPHEHWIALYREIAAAIPDGPASAKAEELLDRWYALAHVLWQELALDPASTRRLHEGFARAWQDRENWPGTLTRRFADYRMNEVSSFIGKVSIVVLNRRGSMWFEKTRERSASVTQRVCSTAHVS